VSADKESWPAVVTRDWVLAQGAPGRVQLLRVVLVALLVVGLVNVYLDHGAKEDLIVEYFLAVAIAGIGLTGGWIIGRYRQADERQLGWVLLIAAVGAAFVFSTDYATYAFAKGLPSGQWVAWLGDLLFFPGVAILLGQFLVRLPDGKVSPDRLMRVALGLGLAAGASMLFAKAFEPRLYSYREWRGGQFSASPLAHLVSSNAVDVVLGVGYTLLGAMLLTAAIGLFRRMQRPSISLDEYRRIKWFQYSILLIFATIVPLAIFGAGTLAALAGAVVALSVPYVTYHALATPDWPRSTPRRVLQVFLLAIVAGGLHALSVDRLGRMMETLIPSAFLATLAGSIAFQPVWGPGERTITGWLDILASAEDLLGMMEEDIDSIAERVGRAKRKESARARRLQGRRDEIAAQDLSADQRAAIDERVKYENRTAEQLEGIKQRIGELKRHAHLAIGELETR
jgi:hypothetical protein